MTVDVNSTIILGVKKELIESNSDTFKLREFISHYLEDVKVPIDFAGWFFLMKEEKLDVLNFTSDYYHMIYERTYIGDPDLPQTDPGDDELLQHFLQKIPEGNTFSCLVSIKDRKVFSHLTGETTFEEIDPIPLKNNDLILLECGLYY